MESGPRSPKGRRTRARLLEAGKAVFERDGFLQARISDIAAEAGVSHGSFYHYFGTKEELFREVAEEVEVRLISMDDIALDEDAGPIDRIRAANRSYLSGYRKEARIMRVIEEVTRYNEEVRKVRSKRDDYLTAFPPPWSNLPCCGRMHWASRRTGAGGRRPSGARPRHDAARQRGTAGRGVDTVPRPTYCDVDINFRCPVTQR